MVKRSTTRRSSVRGRPRAPARRDVRGDRALGVVVADLDHQGVPLPAAARRPVPAPDLARRQRAAVDRDDPRLVDHLVEDDHVARRLENPVAGAVAGREDPPGHAAGDAPLPRGVVHVGVGQVDEVVVAGRAGVVAHRNPAVRRLDHHGPPALVARRAARPVAPGSLRRTSPVGLGAGIAGARCGVLLPGNHAASGASRSRSASGASNGVGSKLVQTPEMSGCPSAVRAGSQAVSSPDWAATPAVATRIAAPATKIADPRSL